MVPTVAEQDDQASSQFLSLTRLFSRANMLVVIDALCVGPRAHRAHSSKATQTRETMHHSSRGDSWFRASGMSPVQMRPVSALPNMSSSRLQRRNSISRRAGQVVGASVAVDAEDVSASYKRLQVIYFMHQIKII